MNKKLFILSALAAVTGLMTSCSNDDDLTPESSMSNLDANTITFSMPKSANTPQTRSGVTMKSLTDFYVTSVNEDKTIYFSDEHFSYNNDKDIFQSQTPHYWPTTGTLNFYAISNIGTSAINSSKVPEHTFTDWQGEEDLVAATVKAGEKTIPYPLTFNHVLSQVYISAEAQNKTVNLTYKLVSVNMTVPSTGTYTFAAETGGMGTWKIDNTRTSQYSYADVLPLSFAYDSNLKITNCYWNILPVTTGSLDFDIEYQVLQNGKVIADFTGANKKRCVVDNPNLLSGKKYTYNFILSRGTNEEITFSVTMNDWAEGATEDYDIPQKPTAISLSKERVAVPLGKTTTLTATLLPLGSEASIEWSVEDETIASVDQNGTITANALGTTTLTVTTSNGITAEVPVVVVDLNGYDYVDLGLPSGILWAVKNVGADGTYDIGKYFCWGETTGYYATSLKYGGFTMATYKYQTNSQYTKYTPSDGLVELELADDAARANMGGDWRMPRSKDYEELIANTTNSFVQKSNKYVFCLTSKINSEDVYFEQTSYYYDKKEYDYSSGRYHCADRFTKTKLETYNWAFRIDYSMAGVTAVTDSGQRYIGFCVRGVIIP